MISKEAVTWGYRILLGREPEDDAVVEDASKLPNLEIFRHNVIKSAEFTSILSEIYSGGRVEKIVIAEIRNGLRIFINLYDRFVSRGCLYDDYEPVETGFLLRHITEGSTVLDIGANIGWFTLLSAAKVGPFGRVYAFEPRHDTFRLLERSVFENGFNGRVSLVQAAVAEAIGERQLVWASTDENPGGTYFGTVSENQNVQDTPTITLDSMGINHEVDFIKIDVEGAEGLALRGGEHLIRRYKPIILSEVHTSQLQSISKMAPFEYVSYIVNLGYRCVHLDIRGDEIPIESPDYFDTKPLINVAFLPIE